MGIYQEWHAQQCRAYKKESEHYEAYAKTLEQILKAACQLYAPHGMVQARAKDFGSFAAKMARKAAAYGARGTGPTDLCGARVITETQAEVDSICAWIRDTFVIDEANSVDVRTRLKTAEFGYLSVHYVVQVRGAEILGVKIPEDIGDRKAEIQVRTLLQHTWASISHDRIYKPGFRVLEHLKRDVARVAALLEEAEQQSGAAVRAIDAYRPHYGAYMDKDQLKEEIETLTTVRDCESDPDRRIAAELQLARVERSIGNWKQVEQLLAPRIQMTSTHRFEVLAEHGHALCRLHQDHPREAPFRQGQTEIAQAVDQTKGDVRTRALAYRAWASARVPENEEATRAHYCAAFDADPQNPFHLAAHIEYELAYGAPLGLGAVTRPALEAAIGTCRAYADANIELPWTFLTMGRLYLLLDQPYESLAAYAKAIRLCLTNPGCAPDAAFEGELAFLRHINHGHAYSERHDWVRQQLRLAQAMLGAAVANDAPKRAFQTPVVILAGGTAPGSEAAVGAFRETLLKAFEGFGGTVISGGTRAGLAGLAGELAALGVQAIGYVPKNLPFDQPADPRYSAFVASAGSTYGAASPLRYWTDLLRAGVQPSEVRLVGIDGGQIAAFEYRLALALGARVGLLQPATRAAASLLSDADWKADPNLLALPKDVMTLHVFIQAPRTPLSGEQADTLAQRIHANFLEANRYQNPDPVMQPWEKLRADLQGSHRMQAECAAAFLERIGYRVERASGGLTAVVLTEEEVERLSEMEHGRWVVERLQSGWRYGDKRDPANKLSPSLIPWGELSEEVKGYDRDAVRKWPGVLGTVGLQVSRP